MNIVTKLNIAHYLQSIFHRGLLSIAMGIFLCYSNSLSAGILTITFTEDGGGTDIISVSYSGSLDFIAGDSTKNFSFSRFINPAGGTMSFAALGTLARYWQADGNNTGAIQRTNYSGTLGSNAIFAGYGTGSYAADVLNVTPGSTAFALYLDHPNTSAGLKVARDYISGDPLSGSATLSGTFASRGITSGTSWTEFTLDGQYNKVEFIAAQAVPEPSTAIAMGLLGIVGFAGNRCRRRQGSVA
jgi:hypothetical protein